MGVTTGVLTRTPLSTTCTGSGATTGLISTTPTGPTSITGVRSTTCTGLTSTTGEMSTTFTGSTSTTGTTSTTATGSTSTTGTTSTTSTGSTTIGTASASSTTITGSGLGPTGAGARPAWLTLTMIWTRGAGCSGLRSPITTGEGTTAPASQGAGMGKSTMAGPISTKAGPMEMLSGIGMGRFTGEATATATRAAKATMNFILNLESKTNYIIKI
ncbi:hypothetical protein O3G_MSEX010891 [Manduca sexta]|uniref:Uncharacterized protein n=1 Tax=Manduca sexta TaxID=7130 RepID=A0A921ZKR2_MANSE|nr:hypothetical protein O3G_MSEX010891 [Manduca sexta]